MYTDMTPTEWLTGLGFTDESTGGGYSAAIRMDGEIMEILTNYADAFPTNWDDRVTLTTTNTPDVAPLPTPDFDGVTLADVRKAVDACTDCVLLSLRYANGKG